MIVLLLPMLLAAESPRVEALPAEIRAAVVVHTWHEGCPVSPDSLAWVTVEYLSPSGAVETGHLVVHQDQAAGVAQVFERLLAARFVIEKVAPAHEYGGDDDLLMAKNITSAFNCRPVAGGASFSEHSYGTALDLNPLWNPYVRNGKVLPPEGAVFEARDPARVGTIVGGDAVVQAFGGIGWIWGGTWKNSKDYQHFSLTGR